VEEDKEGIGVNLTHFDFQTLPARH